MSAIDSRGVHANVGGGLGPDLARIGVSFEGRQTDRQTDTLTDRLTDRQTDRQTDKSRIFATEPLGKPREFIGN